MSLFYTIFFHFHQLIRNLNMIGTLNFSLIPTRCTKLLFFRVVLLCFICGLPKLAFGFAVAPMGLSGTYLPFGNYAKAGKSGSGVSWSKNLDSELQLRKTLCNHIPYNLMYQYRFDNSTKACYKVGEQGPCGDNMVFFGYQTNAVYGQCDCNYNDNGRALILDPLENMCHFVYTRGYCNENEWLAFDSNWNPICEKNKCLQLYEHVNNVIPDKKSQKAVSVEFVPYNDSCILLGTSCEDKDPQWMGSLSYLPHEIQFVKGKLYPRCAPMKYVTWRYPTPKLQCVPGGLLSQNALNKKSTDKCHGALEV